MIRVLSPPPRGKGTRRGSGRGGEAPPSSAALPAPPRSASASPSPAAPHSQSCPPSAEKVSASVRSKPQARAETCEAGGESPDEEGGAGGSGSRVQEATYDEGPLSSLLVVAAAAPPPLPPPNAPAAQPQNQREPSSDFLEKTAWS